MAEVDKNTEVVHVIDGSGAEGTFQEGDDLKEEVVETIGTYLRCITSEGELRNQYKVSAGIQRTRLTDENGDPAPLDDSIRGAENAFARSNLNPQINRYSDSGQIFSPSINDYIEKGKTTDEIKNLPSNSNRSGGSNPPTPDNRIVQAVVSALDNNRFSPGPRGPYVNDGNAPNVFGRLQTEFGRHTQDGPDITFDNIGKIADSLMFRAARELRGVQDSDPDDVNPAALLVPGGAQVALTRPNTNELRASTVMDEVFGIQKPKTDTDPQINKGTESWGQLNTPSEPFGGFLPIGMTVIAFALVVSLRLVVQGLLALLGLIVKDKGSAKIPNRGPFIIGEFGKADPPARLFSLRAIGINDTERDFLTCVDEGLDVFFEFNRLDAGRVARNPQFYTIFVRNIIRSGNTIIQEIQDVFSSGFNPLEAAQAFIGLIDVLKSSKIIAFLNIMAQLGDKALAVKEQGFSPDSRKKSSIENLPNNPAANVMKIRGSRSELKSGMQTSATVSKFVLPNSILKAGSLMGGDFDMGKVAAAFPSKTIAQKKELENNRLSPETVAKIESELDSEYVPFYFQDLRTNEIISFHAFLNSLDDNYTPTYESQNAYGRIDAVRTYANTERTLNFSFKILATNKEDFDYMWWKINKLSSLVYPSWTEGRQVSAGNNKFIQPFSQLPGSTPLIRVRIGDLIRSNYSKFGLARLFGVGTDKSDILSGNDKVPDIKAIQNKRKRMLRNPAVTGEPLDGYQPGDEAFLLPKRDGYRVVQGVSKVGQRVKALFGQETNKRLVITANTKVKIEKDSFGGKLPRGLANKTSFLAGDDNKYGEHKVQFYSVTVLGPAGESDEANGTYLVTHDDLVPDPKYLAENFGGGLPDPTIDLTDIGTPSSLDPDPFDPNQNAIVRSFRSIQGKGLGGVITSLSFTEIAGVGAGVWETSDFGARAPKMINCNISYAVIHDIAPGLDNEGFMRAMQYPVGEIAHRISGDNYGGEENDAKQQFRKNHADIAVGLLNPNRKDD